MWDQPKLLNLSLGIVQQAAAQMLGALSKTICANQLSRRVETIADHPVQDVRVRRCPTKRGR